MGTATVVLDCRRFDHPDLATIESLARIQQAAFRRGFELRLANAGPHLLDLIRLAGLDGVLRVEVPRQAEERKQPGCVEEEGELGDAAL